MIDARAVPGWLAGLAGFRSFSGSLLALWLPSIFSSVDNRRWQLWAYWRFGRTGRDNGRDRRKPFRQTTFVGDRHCGAGCTVGDFAGEQLSS